MKNKPEPAAFAVLTESGKAIRIWWSGAERERAERIAAEDFCTVPVSLYTEGDLREIEKQRDELLAAFNQAISKVESATCCHPNAVRTLLDEAIEIWGASITNVKGGAA